MLTLIKNATQIITVDTKGKNYKRGNEMKNLFPLFDHSILIENGVIKDFIPNSKKINVDEEIDASNCIVLPGLVECHTHSAFAGSRSNEFLMRLKGASYEEIAAAGGGIVSTMKAVRNSSFDDLLKLLNPKINHFISQGVTTLEIKSGYGLSFYDEIKLLQVINYFKKNSRINIIPTFLGAHTYPPEYKNDHKSYIDLIINQLLPYIKENNLADSIDAFLESSAFSYDEVDQIFNVAKKLGFNLRLHTDQFNSIGGIDLAIKHKINSVDHLEVINENDIEKISKSKIATVLLPGVSFFLDYQYAPARKLIDKNSIVALSTDYNPGSSHIPNIHLIMQLAALKLKMEIEEIISAVTINSSYALGISDKTGSIEIGKEASFSIFSAKDISEIIYNIGYNLIKYTISKGKIIYSNSELK
ncbi:MAG: imidazolonepropionase [Melioribacteraceae bacterium]|nr:imidazolonepropionase [Melioribacteraceae bacterium]